MKNGKKIGIYILSYSIPTILTLIILYYFFYYINFIYASLVKDYSNIFLLCFSIVFFGLIVYAIYYFSFWISKLLFLTEEERMEFEKGIEEKRIEKIRYEYMQTEEYKEEIEFQNSFRLKFGVKTDEFLAEFLNETSNCDFKKRKYYLKELTGKEDLAQMITKIRDRRYKENLENNSNSGRFVGGIATAYLINKMFSKK